MEKNDKDEQKRAEECFFLGLLSGNPSKGIEMQESLEQRRVVAAQRLPRWCDSLKKEDARKLYSKVGIEVINEADDLFYNVQLPEGWEVKSTGHSMWNTVHDSLGRERFKFFYKGAFYDRSAFIFAVRRYTIETEYEDLNDHDNRNRYHAVKDAVLDAVLFTTETTGDYDTSDQHSKDCAEWLAEHFPQWGDPFAYWDIPEQENQ